MNLRKLLVASAIGLCIAAPLRAADPQLIADAKAFGAREAVIRPDLSADGSQVIYVTPGPARTSVAVVGNLDTGKFIPVMSSGGDPNVLRWCNFASASRSVCRISGNQADGIYKVIGFSRLLSVNNDGSNPKLLGQTDSFYDAYLRQFDGEVIDWLDRSWAPGKNVEDQRGARLDQARRSA